MADANDERFDDLANYLNARASGVDNRHLLPADLRVELVDLGAEHLAVVNRRVVEETLAIGAKIQNVGELAAFESLQLDDRSKLVCPFCRRCSGNPETDPATTPFEDPNDTTKDSTVCDECDIVFCAPCGSRIPTLQRQDGETFLCWTCTLAILNELRENKHADVLSTPE